MKLIHNSMTQSKIAIQTVNYVCLTNELYLPLRINLHFPLKPVSLETDCTTRQQIRQKNSKTIKLQ